LATDTLSPEVAVQEFDRFVELWDIDGEVESMDEDSRDGFEDHKRRLVRGLRRGSVTIDEEGSVTIQLRWPKMESVTEVVCKPPGGDAMLSWDKYKDRQQVHKLNSFLGSMCGQNPVVFARMDARDLKTVQAIALLFLAS
jgi:hypothetical protein